MMTLRAKLFDDLAVQYIGDGENTIVLHLGCGLDSRCERINQSDADWYDVDFEEVIDIRKHFYRASDKYHMVSSSVTEKAWIDDLPTGAKNVVVLAEGLTMYLAKEEIRQLLDRLKSHFGSYTIIFDAYSTLTARHAGNHPSLKRTGAVIKWGLDDPESMMDLINGMTFVHELYFTEIDSVQKLDAGTRFMYKFAGLFKAARRAHRVLVYRIN